jgi:hypothetical protein
MALIGNGDSGLDFMTCTTAVGLFKAGFERRNRRWPARFLAPDGTAATHVGPPCGSEPRILEALSAWVWA